MLRCLRSFPWLHYLFADFSNFSRCFSLFQKNVCLVAFGIQWKAMSRRNEVIERKTCLVLHLGISGRRKKEEDIDEENLHGTILLLTVNIFARLERMSKPSSDSSSSLLLVYLNELQNIVVLCNYDFFFGGPTPSYMPIDIGLQWIKMYIQCSVGMVQVHSYHDRKGLGLGTLYDGNLRNIDKSHFTIWPQGTNWL